MDGAATAASRHSRNSGPGSPRGPIDHWSMTVLMARIWPEWLGALVVWACVFINRPCRRASRGGRVGLPGLTGHSAGGESLDAGRHVAAGPHLRVVGAIGEIVDHIDS